MNTSATGHISVKFYWSNWSYQTTAEQYIIQLYKICKILSYVDALYGSIWFDICCIWYIQSKSYISIVVFKIWRLRQNGRNFKCIFLNGYIRIFINISLKFISKGQINNIPALFQIKAWRRPGDKPLSEPVMVSLLIHICIIWPQYHIMTHHVMMAIKCIGWQHESFIRMILPAKAAMGPCLCLWIWHWFNMGYKAMHKIWCK